MEYPAKKTLRHISRPAGETRPSRRTHEGTLTQDTTGHSCPALVARGGLLECPAGLDLTQEARWSATANSTATG
jgi:hypothetical protein